MSSQRGLLEQKRRRLFRLLTSREIALARAGSLGLDCTTAQIARRIKTQRRVALLRLELTDVVAQLAELQEVTA